ncbi:MAG: twin-arginine translocase subunit TatC [Bacteroidaceae bacterium]|nr:twin-arginine translocase subunit TatC [Bacteroidaceae bacterium]
MDKEKQTKDKVEVSEEKNFWYHLEELRGCLIRIFVVVFVSGVAAFCFKETMFNVILAPCHSNFMTYRWLGVDAFDLHLINTGLAEQMMIHLKTAMCVGLLAASPYVLYVLFGFISPALYENERRYSRQITLSAYLTFLVGILLNYLFFFPLTVHFLGLYQVSPDIDNMLTISSYVDTLLLMSLAFGIVFEIPVLAWLLAKLHLMKAVWMSQYRRHAIVAILIIAAVITPTTDPFTLIIVSLPIWFLYEISIWIVKKENKAE